MDKNMISIDDLLKQRLSGGEEKERPGAWLQMRELLDEKMPASIAAGYNWRRMFTYFAGLLLLGIASVGGYQAYMSSSTQPLAINERPNAATGSKNFKLVNTTGSTTRSVTSSATGKSTIVTSSGVAKINKDKNVSNVLNINKLNSYNNTATSNKNQKITGNPAPKTNISGPIVNNNQNNTSIPPAIASNSSNISKAPQVPEIKRSNDPHITNPRYVDNKNERTSITYMDSAEMIKTIESPRRGHVVSTTTREMIAREKTYTLPETEQNFVNNPVVAATTTTEDYTMKELKNFKVGSKRYGNANGGLFEEMVQNARMTLSGVSFHPGLMAGISSSVGAYNMTGIQVGVAGMMNISERFMMFTELKFIYRFGNGKSLSNNFNKLRDSSYIGNNTFRYEWDSVEHYYNISNSNSIELPIAVRYSMKRSNIFFGINTAYNFAMNVYEKSTPYGKEHYSSSNSSGLTSGWDKETPVISTNDFSSRFTVGYMLGVGYQISPAVGFDLRVTQPLWDNVKTKGAYQVSKELYRNPSFQFNMTYRLSNNKYKTTKTRGRY